MGARLKHHARLAVFLAFAAGAQFCFLNPQPEPPAGDRGTTTGSGSGGTTTTGGSGGGGGSGGSAGGGPPINPGADGGIVIPPVPDASRADIVVGGDGASLDVGADAPPDAGADGDGDEPGVDGAEDGHDAEDGQDAGETAADVDADRATDSAMDATDARDAVATPEGAAQP